LKLYHFTSVRHMKEIERCGSIKTTCSDIQPDGAGPGVVWLTSNPKAKQAWSEGEAPIFLLEKYGIRITVEVPEKEAHSYPEWSRKMGIDPKWFKLYTERDRDFVNWYVVTRPIGRSEWGAVEMWEGFRDGWLQGYSRKMYESFNSFLAGTQVQAWIVEAMNRDIDPVDGVDPVPVEEWLKMRGAMKREGAMQTERLLGGIRNAGGGGRKAKR